MTIKVVTWGTGNVGQVAVRAAINHPELLRSLILMDTSADPEPEQNRGPYRRLAFVGRWFGFRPVVKPVMKIMFGNSFLADPAAEAARRNFLIRITFASIRPLSRRLCAGETRSDLAPKEQLPGNSQANGPQGTG